MKKLIFISVLAFSFLACEDKSTKEKVNDSKNSLENGDANSSFKYFEGIVAELVSLQIICLNIFDHIESSKEPEDAKTQELAHKLLDESNRIIDLVGGIPPVGNNGAYLKSLANEFFSSSKELAQALISKNSIEILEASEKLVKSESELLAYQQTYANLNNFKLQGEIDPRKLQ